MANTTVGAFNEFYDAISEDESVKSTVTQRRDSVVSTLKSAFPSTSTMRYVDNHLVGSFGRHTASRPFEDIDVMVSTVT